MTNLEKATKAATDAQTDVDDAVKVKTDAETAYNEAKSTSETADSDAKTAREASDKDPENETLKEDAQAAEDLAKEAAEALNSANLKLVEASGKVDTAEALKKAADANVATEQTKADAKADKSGKKGSEAPPAPAPAKPSARDEESLKAKEKFKEILGEGVTSEAQAEKMFALSGCKVPVTADDEDPIEWAYVTHDANVFFSKKAATKHAMKISGGVATAKAAKVFPVKTRK